RVLVAVRVDAAHVHADSPGHLGPPLALREQMERATLALDALLTLGRTGPGAIRAGGDELLAAPGFEGLAPELQPLVLGGRGSDREVVRRVDAVTEQQSVLPRPQRASGAQSGTLGESDPPGPTPPRGGLDAGRGRSPSNSGLAGTTLPGHPSCATPHTGTV